MSRLRPSRTLSVSIDRPADQVYSFVSNPANCPQWMTSFVRAARYADQGWVLETSDGPVGIAFVSANKLGVLDHRATLPSGTEVLNPMRVVPNGEGSEVTFTLFQIPEMTDEQFAADAGTVERDLRTLKRVLDGPIS